MVVDNIRKHHAKCCTLSASGTRSRNGRSGQRASSHECVIDLSVVRDIICCSSCSQLPCFIGCAYDGPSASLYVLLDPTPNGLSLNRVIWDPAEKLQPNWVQRMRWLMDISEGIEYLHQRGIVHGNLRSTNIICFSETPGGSKHGNMMRRDSSAEKEADRFALTRAKLGDPHHFSRIISATGRDIKAWHKVSRDEHAFLWFAPEIIRSIILITICIKLKGKILYMYIYNERSRARF